MKHPHAELLMQLIEDTTLEVEVLVGVNEWGYTTRGHVFHDPSKTSHYRLKPQPIKKPYIKIGQRWVPEPMRVEPPKGTAYWMADACEEVPQKQKWDDDYVDSAWLKTGTCHLTREAAEQHLAALQELHAQPATMLTEEEARK
mgnify:CR=1 FL=1